MKRWLGAFILTTLLAAGSSAVAQEPKVVYSEQRVSVDAKNIPLNRFLQVWDNATGMHSSIPPQLANQPVTVNFFELPLDEAVRRIFEGVPVDFVFSEAQGINVTARSQPPALPTPAPAFVGARIPQTAPGTTNPSPENKPDKPASPKPEPPPPLETPFGPIPNSAQDAVMQFPPVWGPPPPSFFTPVQPVLPTPPPVSTQNDLFRPLPIYQGPNAPPAGPSK